MLKKLLWQDKNKWQIFGAAVGSFIGLFLLLLSLQFYMDFQWLMKGKGSGGEQFLTLNKPVIAYKSHFNAEELATIKSQVFVNKMATFSSNEFKVSASSNRIGFYTELFFESIANDFIDTDTSDFSWEKGQKEIPIIISRDYVALYNFGFAPSQGLPQINPQFMKRFSLDITIKGNGLKRTFKGRIVGYSDRIHSILVPQNFMDWANQTFGEDKKPGPSRLMLATDNPYAEEVTSFLNEKEYELSSGRMIGGHISTLLRSVVSIVALIGLIIVILSALIFVLTFQLIISRSSEDIRLLLQLGYKQDEISKILFDFLLRLFTGVFIATFISLFLFRSFLMDWFGEQGFELSTGFHWIVYLTGALFSLGILFWNNKSIRGNVTKLFYE